MELHEMLLVSLAVSALLTSAVQAQGGWRQQTPSWSPGGRRNNGPSYNPYGGESDSGLGAPCEYDEDCFIMEHTFCKMQQTCQCKMGFKPSRTQDRCLATIGARCVTKYDCASLGTAGDCRQNICDCGQGFLPGPDNTCLKGAIKLSDTCQEDIQCQILDATCQNGKCVCPQGHHAVGNKCSTTRALHEPCDTNDQCYVGEGYQGVVTCYMGTCRCRDLYVETVDGRCSGARRMGTAAELAIFASIMVLFIV